MHGRPPSTSFSVFFCLPGRCMVGHESDIAFGTPWLCTVSCCLRRSFFALDLPSVGLPGPAWLEASTHKRLHAWPRFRVPQCHPSKKDVSKKDVLYFVLSGLQNMSRASMWGRATSPGPAKSLCPETFAIWRQEDSGSSLPCRRE
jgi:hypothetical protein